MVDTLVPRDQDIDASFAALSKRARAWLLVVACLGVSLVISSMVACRCDRRPIRWARNTSRRTCHLQRCLRRPDPPQCARATHHRQGCGRHRRGIRDASLLTAAYPKAERNKAVGISAGVAGVVGFLATPVARLVLAPRTRRRR
jgi:hypothetical protein